MIDLVDDDPDIVGRMLIWMYNPHYYASVEEWYRGNECEMSLFSEATRRQALVIPNDRYGADKIFAYSLILHAKLNGLANKYDIPALARLSCDRFVEFVVYAIDLGPALTFPTSNARDLIDVIKLVYGSEQESDRILQEAAVYLARLYAESIPKPEVNVEIQEEAEIQENARDFQKIFSSTNDFAWDMITIDFCEARFSCENCNCEFANTEIPWLLREDKCGQRGLCGNCGPIGQLTCFKCTRDGYCRLIRSKDTKAKLKSKRKRTG